MNSCCMESKRWMCRQYHFNTGQLYPSQVHGPECPCHWRVYGTIEHGGKCWRERRNRSCKYEPREHTHGISNMAKKKQRSTMPLNEQQQQKIASGWNELWWCPRELGSPGKEGTFFIKTAMLILTRMNLKEYFCSFRAKEQKSLSRTNHFHSFYIVFFSLPKSCVWDFYSWMIFVPVCAQSVVSDFFQTHGLQPTRLLCPWNFPGKTTGAGYYFFLQGIFSTQGLNMSLLHWQTDSIPQSHLGSISWVKMMERILTVCPTQYQSDRESKKKKKWAAPLSTLIHTQIHWV